MIMFDKFLKYIRISAIVSIFFCVFLASTVIASPTGKIAGKITMADTEEPLPGVNIMIEGTTHGAASDLQGNYFIGNIYPGVYTLRATMIGFKDVVVTDVHVQTDGTTYIDITMEETILEIGGEVVVVAQRPLVEIDNTTTRVILESTEIRAHPTPNVIDVITSLPSINVEDGIVRVRGGTLDEVAIMIDGARYRNPLNQSTSLDINMSAIQELEVIVGSYNAEYGEARSGVFNVVLREGGSRYSLSISSRYQSPGIRHWGRSMYDYSTDLYWENTHARHLEWWIEYPDMWVDPNGIPGSDPRSIWTPEVAYQHYMETHQPINDYGNTPSYDFEGSLGGPIPGIRGLSFYLTGRYRTKAPFVGNSYRDRGIFSNYTGKFTYRLTQGIKMDVSGFFNIEKTSWGIEDYVDLFWATSYGINGRYAYFDTPGLPESRTDGQTVKFVHVLDERTMYELLLSRVNAYRKVDVFPDDPFGWEAAEGVRDNLRAVDENGNPIPGGYQNYLGYNTQGYYYRYNGNYTDWTLRGYLTNHMSMYWNFKTGFEFTYYNLDHFNQSKLPDRRDSNVYNPYQGAVYAQNKLEFGGFIMNIGLRFDFYNPNDYVYLDLFDPFTSPKEKSKTFTQLSPRIGVSHPIDDKTVLRFSYGHFFQRGPFGDYGEGNAEYEALGSLTTFVVDDGSVPWVLGNRNVKPQKNIEFEVGIDRNFAEFFILSATAYYKDISNTLRVVTVQSPIGIYRTNGNGNYADERGFEISLRKLPSHHIWGSINFTTRSGIWGRSGDPRVISPDRHIPAESGDFISHNNPRLKSLLVMQSPQQWNFLWGILKDISLSFEYHVTYPNKNLRSDYFLFEGVSYVRHADKVANLRIRKDMRFIQNNINIALFMEVRNLFNDKWLMLSVFESASRADQEKFVKSGFKDIPDYNSNGVPILDLAKYRNLPRSFIFGISLEM
jgi:outer membrane receptor protein involved in Fe transport